MSCFSALKDAFPLTPSLLAPTLTLDESRSHQRPLFSLQPSGVFGASDKPPDKRSPDRQDAGLSLTFSSPLMSPTASSRHLQRFYHDLLSTASSWLARTRTPVGGLSNLLLATEHLTILRLFGGSPAGFCLGSAALTFDLHAAWFPQVGSVSKTTGQTQAQAQVHV